MQKLGINSIAARLTILIQNLRHHEIIEIKQKDYTPGEISIVVKSTVKEDYQIEESD